MFETLWNEAVQELSESNQGAVHKMKDIELQFQKNREAFERTYHAALTRFTQNSTKTEELPLLEGTIKPDDSSRKPLDSQIFLRQVQNLKFLSTWLEEQKSYVVDISSAEMTVQKLLGLEKRLKKDYHSSNKNKPLFDERYMLLEEAQDTYKLPRMIFFSVAYAIAKKQGLKCIEEIKNDLETQLQVAENIGWMVWGEYRGEGTLLHACASLKDIDSMELFQYLIERCPPNGTKRAIQQLLTPDRSDKTVFYYAAENGHEKIALWLIEHYWKETKLFQAYNEFQSVSPGNALHAVCMGGKLEILEALKTIPTFKTWLNEPQQLRERSHQEGCKPLFLAIYQCNSVLAKRLVELGQMST